MQAVVLGGDFALSGAHVDDVWSIVDDGDVGTVGWETTISTQYSDVGIKATTDAAEGFDVFTYEITNLSYRPEGPGIGALGISLPIAAMAITSPSGWKASQAIGTLGGFLAYSSKDGMGIAVGETSSVSFSLPAPPASAPPPKMARRRVIRRALY